MAFQCCREEVHRPNARTHRVHGKMVCLTRCGLYRGPLRAQPDGRYLGEFWSNRWLRKDIDLDQRPVCLTVRRGVE